ncbi:MAG: hypothetical protein R3301_03325 [Saprospiraceae bacterium]|nr:hypothetical protein [Saprospiraceae bacterium]
MNIDRIVRLGILLIAVVTLASCSARLSPFTQEIYDRAGLSENELTQIQFYLSEDIVLRRGITAGETVVKEGKIRMVDGRRVEEVRIPRGTPGVLLFTPRENRFAISFEEGDDDAYLMFGPNPKIDDRYALLAREWKRNRGKVSYKGRLYDVDATSAYSVLLVDLKRVGQTEYRSHRASGRKVN